MIVILGSRHDAVACSLRETWSSAALCSAEDLSRPGWVWHRGTADGASWVVEGEVVRDEDVTGVFVRRTSVYGDELLGTHPDDRAYLAAEARAFLIFVLATTGATVVNDVADGALGEERLGVERWVPAAAALGIPIAPIRLASGTPRPMGGRLITVEVVDGEAFGEGTGRMRERAVLLADALDLRWMAATFDGRGRLITISCATAPRTDATAALGRFLEMRRSA